MAIEVGQSVKFPFAGKSMEGIVVQVHPKTVVIRADFPKHKGKIVRRQAHELGDKVETKTSGGLVKRFLEGRKRAKAEKVKAVKKAAKEAKAKSKGKAKAAAE
ncbi:MAG: hypothetical protein IPK07_02275 [Deltaproteobacteria bacterium]|jgi:hypothetical protein|nr:hypothetical protein [Deltaproteobacteria bacterium]